MEYTEKELMIAVARGMVSGEGKPITVGARRWRQSAAAGLSLGLTGAEPPEEQVAARKAKPDAKKAALLAEYEAIRAEVAQEAGEPVGDKK